MTARKAFSPVRPKSIRAQITDHMREQITSGAFAPGDRLPSTQELARTWNTPVATVHAALTPLVKEGLISRTRRRGTIVERPSTRLDHVAVYLPSNLLSGSDGAFVRAVCVQVEAVMRERGGVVDIWIDPRPERDRSTCWDALLDATRRRTVQAVIAPRSEGKSLSWIQSLPVPTAFLSMTPQTHCVSFDTQQFARDGVAELARVGCRSVGLVSVLAYPKPQKGSKAPSEGPLLREFRAQVKRLGLETRPAWIKTPKARRVGEAAAEAFGYDSMTSILRASTRPRGVLIFTDIAARGALVAAAEAGAPVPDELALAVHRNAEVGFFCPYPVSYLDVNVTAVSESLIDILDAQLRGEEAPPAVMGYAVSRPKRARRDGTSRT